MAGMRKWVMAGLAVVAIGLAAYSLSRPKPGSIAYHRVQYLEANHIVQGAGIEGTKLLFYTLLGQQRRWMARFIEASKVRSEEQAALVKLGYLQQRVFFAKNLSGHALSYHLQLAARRDLDPKRLPFFDAVSEGVGNDLRVVCRPEDMQRIVAWMKRDYVPSDIDDEGELYRTIPKL